MKRRVAYFLLCVCFCFSSLSLSSSAVDQDIINQGWLYDESDDSYYKEAYMEMYMPSLLIASDPNFDFDPNKIPWIEAPTSVQDIVFSEMPKLYSATDLKVPFLAVVVYSSYVRVFAGWNLCIGRINTNYVDGTSTRGRIRLMYFNNMVTSAHSICYSADFNRDYSVRVPWRALESTDFGTTGYTETYNNYFGVDLADKVDFYMYGANYCKSDPATTIQVLCNNKTNANGVSVNYYSAHFNQSPIGFASGTFIPYPDDFDNCYFTSFTPKSIEQVEHETQKGIWDSIKSIPDMIGEKLKGLFIPAEGFFSTYVGQYQEYFKDRFGLLYELPESIISILQQFISYTPAESGYSINFPEVVMPVLENGEWCDKTIIEETDITFEFLEQGAFKTLYTMYRSVVWMIFIFALINLIIRKSERVFGGGG